MSFRLFIYYCALCGGWAALFGWLLGRVASPGNPLGRDGIRGMMLGIAVALGLSLVDCLWNLSLRQIGVIFMRVGVAILVGGVGGLLGGLIGNLLFSVSPIFFVFGWTLTGLLIGASIGMFEFLSSVINQKNLVGSRKKLVKCLLGGTAGGILGGVLALLLRLLWLKIAANADFNWLWSPTAMGFVALGMCIGLLVGLAQVILKEAWVRVEAGFRTGREMIISKERTTIGRAEKSDIALFGDAGVEKLHANIVLENGRYVLEDATTPGGTYVNDQRVNGRVYLRSGDLIRVGRSVLRFFERRRQR
ncbi:MAG: FHA domain-containing protein [Gemmataceae bacterium]|nr:FHA domain-containing protein [Gemmataceae bacterium]MCI0740437.1 FHA domain-containing protein [Gemmataceae bacterium]